MKNKRYSSFLFPKPSTLTGIGSAFNVCGNYYMFNYSPTEVEADHKAFICDWYSIGADLNEAIESEKNQKRLEFVYE